MGLPAKKAAVPLAEYQERWVQDHSRFKIGVISRQGGKSFATSLEAVFDCLAHKTDWVFLSAGERQSKELMGTAAKHAKALGLAVQELESQFFDWEEKTTYKQLEIRFPNGSRIIGLPANPSTARGNSANILLDEFAFHADSYEIWKALFPTITRGYKIRIISTFQGRNNKFYELFFSAPTLQTYDGKSHEYKGERGGWSKHRIDIYQAVEMGLELRDDNGDPCEPEDLRLALNDEDAWTEEYECQPSDEAHSFLPHSLISSVEDVQLNPMPAWATALVEAAEENYQAYVRTKQPPPLPTHVFRNVEFTGELFVGMDIGRTRDLTVIWVDQRIDGVLHTAAVIELKACPFFKQKQVLHTILKRKESRRACIDKTGIGADLAEDAVIQFGEAHVEGIDFNAGNKEAMAGGVKTNFEDRLSRIPADATIRRSLHAVKRFATATGHFRFDAERTDKTGHSDHFWAKALATQAASGPAEAFGSHEVKKSAGWARRVGIKRLVKITAGFRRGSL